LEESGSKKRVRRNLFEERGRSIEETGLRKPEEMGFHKRRRRIENTFQNRKKEYRIAQELLFCSRVIVLFS